MRVPRPVDPVLLIALLSLVGCGHPNPGPRPPAPDRSTVRVVPSEVAEFLTEGSQVSETLPVSAARVWNALPGAYEALGIPVTEVLPGAMTLGNPSFETRRIEGNRMSRYFNCGTTYSGVVANLYDVAITISTRLAEAPEGGTMAITEVDAWATPRTVSGNPVHCSSKQTLEARLNELLAEALGGG